ADVEVEAEASQARFVNECAEVGGIAHFAGGVLDGYGYADVARMKNQMLERTERCIALARIGRLPRSAHVENQPRKGQVFGDIDYALQLVHGLNAAHAFHFGDGEWRAAF